MRIVLAVILKFISILLAGLAVVGTIFVLLLVSFNRTILNRQIVRQAFIKDNAYERVPAEIASEFTLVKRVLVNPCAEEIVADSCLDQTVGTAQIDGTSTSRLGIQGRAFINAVNQDQWKKLVIYLVTPNDFQASVENSVDEAIAYFKGETDTVKLPLTILKARLGSMEEDELTAILLSSQPTCTPEQQALIMSGEIGELGSPPIFCSGSGGTAQVLLLDLQRRLNAVASEFPEHIVFIEPPPPSNPARLQMLIGKDLQSTLQKINGNSQNLPFLPFALLLLATLFGVRSLRGLLRWWGIPIFIAGLIALILGAVIFFMFDQIWLNYILATFPPILTSDFGKIIYGVAHSLANDLAKQIMLLAGIVTLLALGFILISNRIPPPLDPSLPPLAQPGTPGGPVLNRQKKKKRW
jgi:hypothetical protein